MNYISPIMKDDCTILRWVDSKSGFSRTIRLSEKTIDRFFQAPSDAPASVELHLSVPLKEVNGVWTPYGDRSALQKIVWRGRETGSPFFRPGLISLVDRSLVNRFAFLPGPGDTEFVSTWQLDQAGGRYDFTVQWADSRRPRTRGVRISTERLPAGAVAARLIAAKDDSFSRHPRSFYEPSYCTWYAFHGALEQKRVEACARRAGELGFGCFIMDDGWMYDADQRVCGALGPWHRGNGDYEPSKRKFPDFRACLETIRSLGMRNLLWIAPYIVGQESRSFRKLKKHLLTPWLTEGFLSPDPRCPAVVEHLEEKLVSLVERFPLDGFKVDYDYALFGPGGKLYGLGEAYVNATRRLIAAVRRVNPDFEWNLIPNAASVSLTNAFRCCDVPYDPETNRLFMANLKTLAGKAVLHYDPSLWRPDDSLETVYRHMAPSLFCVPSLGADIMALPKSHLKAIRDCLGFYRRHQPLLNGGDFRATWGGGDYQNFRTVLGGAQIIATFSSYPVELGACRETRLINAGSAARVVVQAPSKAHIETETLDGRRAARSVSVPAGIHAIPCPPGSVLRIRR
jgi:alpha-galactosidase